jgi:hypothetical protein
MRVMVRTALAFLCGAAFGAMALAQAQSRPPAGPALTALDYAEIQQLAARYAHAIDTCGDNGYDYARLYTRDGVYIDKWSPKGFASGGIRAEGYEALARVAGGGPGGCTNSARWDLNHVMANHVITPTPEGATGRVYLVELWGGTEPSHVLRAGGYEDVYVKTPDGWRFKQRTHVRDKTWHPAPLQTADLMSPPRPTPGQFGQPRTPPR